MGSSSASAAKNRIMEAALDEFNVSGIRGVSADTIIERAGVAKMTFYKHYPSKDSLAAAYLRERSDRWIAWMVGRVEKAGGSPKRRLLAIFDALNEWFTSDEFFGCPFHRASADFPDPKNPLHKEVVRNEKRILALIGDLVRAAGLDERSQIVNQLRMLMAGAEVMANINGDPKYTRMAQRAAKELIS